MLKLKNHFNIANEFLENVPVSEILPFQDRRGRAMAAQCVRLSQWEKTRNASDLGEADKLFLHRLGYDEWQHIPVPKPIDQPKKLRKLGKRMDPPEDPGEAMLV